MMGGPRILIADGGYGGMHTALRLEQLLGLAEATVMLAGRALCAPAAQHAYRQARRPAGNITAVLRGGTPRPYRHPTAGSVASLGLYRGVAEVYGLGIRGFPAWITHHIYHLMRLPTMSRRLRVVSDWTLALMFPREVVSLDVLEHPRHDFQAVLRVIATEPHRATPFPGQEKKEDDHHAYHQ